MTNKQKQPACSPIFLLLLVNDTKDTGINNDLELS